MGDTTEVSEQPPRPEDPVLISVDSVDPAPDSSPLDESRTALYERTRGDPAPADCERGRGKRPRSPEFVPEKRIKHNALRLALVGNRDFIKAHRARHGAAVDGARHVAHSGHGSCPRGVGGSPM